MADPIAIRTELYLRSQAVNLIYREVEKQVVAIATRGTRLAAAAAAGQVSTAWYERAFGPEDRTGRFFEPRYGSDRATQFMNFGLGTIADSVDSAVRVMGGELAGAMMEFSRLLDDRMRRRQGLAAVHARVAAKAKRSMMSAYSGSVGGTPDYRKDAGGQWRRYAGGQLKRGLGDPNLIIATNESIVFAPGVLDGYAPQWYRINFGAGFRGSQTSPRMYTMANFGLKLGFNAKPSAPFYMPTGIWSEETGKTFRFGGRDVRERKPTGPVQTQFNRHGGLRQGPTYRYARGSGGRQGGWVAQHDSYGPARYGRRSPYFLPVGYLIETGKPFKKEDLTRRRLTKGIEGAQFLDAVPRILATELPKEYLRLAEEWLSQAAAGAARAAGESAVARAQAARLGTLGGVVGAFRTSSAGTRQGTRNR